MFRYFCVLLVITYVTTLVQGKCESGIHGYVPTSVYDDLRCTAVHDSSIDQYCPVKYDCSNIYNRPKNTCHFKGKSYKIGESIDNEELTGVWANDCACTTSLEFSCPELTDGCAEDWVGGYPKPGCYLGYELNSYCASDEICPPFDKNTKCEVKGKIYREGDKFTHPDEKCVQCVCNKNFDGKLEKPSCQPVNCTAEIQHSKAIDKYCAPYYDYTDDSCCPKTWICPSENGKFTPNPVGTPRNQPGCIKNGEEYLHRAIQYRKPSKKFLHQFVFNLLVIELLMVVVSVLVCLWLRNTFK